jgi:hypothetical protein
MIQATTNLKLSLTLTHSLSLSRTRELYSTTEQIPTLDTIVNILEFFFEAEFGTVSYLE